MADETLPQFEHNDASANRDSDASQLNKNEQVPYPNQEKAEGADNEQFIINNSNGNGINPNPTESGNNPDWIDGRKQNDDYIEDATD